MNNTVTEKSKKMKGAICLNKSVVIHQPNFLPRMKVFLKIAISDIWIVYDDVQYVRREWQNRVYLRDAEQRPILFTAPIKKADFFEKIMNIKLLDSALLNENLYKYFQFNYSKAPYLKWVLDYLETIMRETLGVTDLSTYNVISTYRALEVLGLRVEKKHSSDLNICSKDRNGKLIELCEKSNSRYYVCGSGGMTYINEDVFKEAGISIIYYDYSKINQTAFFKPDDYRNYSFLDFIAYNGPEALHDLIYTVKKIQVEDYI